MSVKVGHIMAKRCCNYDTVNTRLFKIFNPLTGAIAVIFCHIRIFFAVVWIKDSPPTRYRAQKVRPCGEKNGVQSAGTTT